MKQVNIQIPLRMLGLLLGLFLSVGAFAQIEVKGHVKDATGEPIIGATVRVDGTQTATVSDFDGNFVLKANQGANITISYVGYQNATVKAAPSVEVTLVDDETVLQDVVVIGPRCTDYYRRRCARCWCEDPYPWWLVTFCL